ncbi:MAG: hypothetical protein AVDCRST_MAG64-1706, partial [uncultured Phycisphaerae bacterium]
GWRSPGGGHGHETGAGREGVQPVRPADRGGPAGGAARGHDVHRVREEAPAEARHPRDRVEPGEPDQPQRVRADRL